jgi:hypothetical protein
MKFENLDLLKFEKIEKNELGKLVGGAAPYTESGAEVMDLGSGGKCEISNDWDNREYAEDGVTVISGGRVFDCGGDMAEAPQAPNPSTR